MYMKKYRTDNAIDSQKLAQIEDEEKFAEVMKDIVEGVWYPDCSPSVRNQIKEIVSDRKIRAGRVKKDLEKELNFVNWEQERITNELIAIPQIKRYFLIYQ
jgi:hypothetical protein